MTIYRLYTEDIHRDRIIEVLNARFDAFTLIPTAGAWKGQIENSLMIELWGADESLVADAATKIASMNQQDAVAVMRVQADITFATQYVAPAAA